MPLEMVLGSNFPWKPGQTLPSSVSWLGVGGGTECGAEAACFQAQAGVGGHCGGARTYRRVHTLLQALLQVPSLDYS